MLEFFSSSEVYRDADGAYEPIRTWLDGEMKSALSFIDTHGIDALIYFIPSIMPPDTAVNYEEVLRYDPLENALEYRPVFDYASFLNAGSKERTRQVIVSLKKVIPFIEKLGLLPEVNEGIISAIESLQYQQP